MIFLQTQFIDTRISTNAVLNNYKKDAAIKRACSKMTHTQKGLSQTTVSKLTIHSRRNFKLQRYSIVQEVYLVSIVLPERYNCAYSCCLFTQTTYLYSMRYIVNQVDRIGIASEIESYKLEIMLSIYVSSTHDARHHTILSCIFVCFT